MKSKYSWNDLKYFLAVARSGGLSRAAALSGTSVPTLSRRMNLLEHQLGQRLFDRDKKGFHLTQAGAEFIAHCEEVEAATLAIDRWRDGRQKARTVRISAGSWTSMHLARNLSDIWRPEDPFRIEFATSEERIDIGRRAADIGIRNRRPKEDRLAGRKISSIAFAAYRKSSLVKVNIDPGWIAVGSVSVQTPSARWVAANHANRIVSIANSPNCALELARSGAGNVVLPCFIGDTEDELARVGETLDELCHDQWLVAHREERNDSAIRTTINRIVLLMKRDRQLMTGTQGKKSGPFVTNTSATKSDSSAGIPPA